MRRPYVHIRLRSTLDVAGLAAEALAVIQLGEGDLGVGIDKGLLINPSDALQRADVKGVLRAAIARALAFELAMRLLVGLRLLERGDLRFGQQDAILRRSGLERFEPVLHRGQ